MDAVRSQQDEVADVASEILGQSRLHAVPDPNEPLHGPNAPGRGVRCKYKPLPTCPWINRGIHAGNPMRGDLGAAAAAGVHQPRALQQRDGLCIGFRARALVQNLSIPLEPERFEHAQNLTDGARCFARAVKVFHPHQPLSLRPPGVEVTTERGNERAEVKGTRRGRRESAAVLGELALVKLGDARYRTLLAASLRVLG
jgi:hypothetical protein